VKKGDLPSASQAQMIALFWARGETIKVCKEGRDGAEPYNTPTIMALIKRGWIDPSGSMPYSENGFLWEPHSITPKGLLALECYLAQLRYDASKIGTLKNTG